MEEKIKVTGAIVSKNGITLFSSDGQSFVLPSDAYKTQEILEATTFAEIAKHGFVEIDLVRYSLAKVLKETVATLPVATQAAVNIVESVMGARIETPTINVEVSDMERHINHRLSSGNGAVGFALFLESFARIPHQHSAEDLLAFMKHADLPIADDGKLIAYKVLRRKHGTEDTFVDCHTGSIPQRVGSRVQMPEGEVNRNRHNSCSTGLHICSRDYFNGFSGDVIALIKVAPEDVITVPHNEHTKVRARAYEIVAVLDKETEADLRKNPSKQLHQDSKGWQVLTAVVAGDHPPVFEIVDVVKGKPTVTPLEPSQIAPRVEPSAGPTETTPKPKPAPRKIKPLGTDKVKKTDKTESIIDTKAVREKIKADMKKLPAKKVTKDSPYEEKFAEAKRLVGEGMSLRNVAKLLGMCRESLSRNLKAA
jgi:hypothetical protein